MNQRDRELLDKQLSWLQPAPRHGSLKIGALATIFLAGISLGGALTSLHTNPAQATPAIGLQAIPASYSTPPRAN